LSLGFDLAVGFGLFTFGGYWLDRRRGGGMGWTLAGAGVGFLYCIYEVWKALKALERDEERNRSGRNREGTDGSAKP
jgi:hypothetical protein